MLQKPAPSVFPHPLRLVALATVSPLGSRQAMELRVPPEKHSPVLVPVPMVITRPRHFRLVEARGVTAPRLDGF
jgi:hypothetical protein